LLPGGVAGESIQVAFDRNACEFISDRPNEVDVVRAGSNVDVIVDGDVAEEPLLCLQTPARARFVLGPLPPGSYTVRIVIRYFFPPFPLAAPSASGPLRVSPAPVPTVDQVSLGVLSMMILSFGLLALAARRTAPRMMAWVRTPTLASSREPQRFRFPAAC
jgi:hypothetical protein